MRLALRVPVLCGSLCLILVPCCSHGTFDRHHGKLLAELLSLSEEARTQLSAKVPASINIPGELDELYQKAQKAVGTKRDKAAIVSLNEFLFRKSGFSREVDDPDVRFMLLPYVIEKKRGSCLGLASLYLAISRRLNLPVKSVLVPGHIFLRLDADDGYTNIELLRQGEAMWDDWYRKKWMVPKHATSYMRGLSDREFLAVLRFNLGNEYRTQGDLVHALKKYTRAAQDFPDLAEAHASMGLVYQMQGFFHKAHDSYNKARKLQADLPGLEKNMAELDRQMKSAGLENFSLHQHKRQ